MQAFSPQECRRRGRRQAAPGNSTRTSRAAIRATSITSRTVRANRDNKKLSVVADRRRNTVIVQAPPGSMAKIGKMIDTLDQPVTDDSLAPKIFPLKFRERRRSGGCLERAIPQKTAESELLVL